MVILLVVDYHSEVHQLVLMLVLVKYTDFGTQIKLLVYYSMLVLIHPIKMMVNSDFIPELLVVQVLQDFASTVVVEVCLGLMDLKRPLSLMIMFPCKLQSQRGLCVTLVQIRVAVMVHYLVITQHMVELLFVIYKVMIFLLGQIILQKNFAFYPLVV